MKIVSLSFICGLCFLYTLGIQAEDSILSVEELRNLSLEELMQVKIITASRSEETLNTAPGVMSVITAKEIEHFGSNSLFEVLERVTSAYMTGFHLSPQNNPSLRGDLASHVDTHVLILVNGRPFRENFGGGFAFSIYLAFPVSMIEKIEIIRGPGSVLYGSNAFVGVINLITKTEAPHQVSSEIGVKQGTFGARALEANGIVNQESFKLAGGIKRFKEDGWPFSAINESGGRGEIPYREDNLGAYLYGESHGFKLNALFVQSAQDIWFIPSASGQMRNENKRILLDLGYEHQFSEGWTAQANVTYNGHDSIFNNIPFVAKNTTHAQSDDVLLEWTNFMKQGRWNWLLGGTTYFLSTGREGLKTHGTSYSLYAQGQYQWTDSLHLIAGGQAVKPLGIDWEVVPRLGMVYQFTSNLGLKLLYSQAFRTSFLEEKFGNSSGILIGNPQLAPETITTADLNLFYNTKNYQLSATYFHSHEQDLIMKVPVPKSNSTTFANAGKVTFDGIELEGKMKPTDRFFLTSSLTYQTNQNQQGKDDYTTVPNWMAKVGVSYEFSKDTSIGLFNNFFSKAHDVSVRFANVKHVNPDTEAFNLMTLNLKMNLQKFVGWPVVLEGYVYNALDEDIYAPEFARSRVNSIPARQGRGVYLGMRYRYE
jgi:outer membrane receptor for ferrienterochelin and colicin